MFHVKHIVICSMQKKGNNFFLLNIFFYALKHKIFYIFCYRLVSHFLCVMFCLYALKKNGQQNTHRLESMSYKCLCSMVNFLWNKKLHQQTIVKSVSTDNFSHRKMINSGKFYNYLKNTHKKTITFQTNNGCFEKFFMSLNMKFSSFFLFLAFLLLLYLFLADLNKLLCDWNVFFMFILFIFFVLPFFLETENDKVFQ